jgi:hypothetical protein
MVIETNVLFLVFSAGMIVAYIVHGDVMETMTAMINLMEELDQMRRIVQSLSDHHHHQQQLWCGQM